MPKHIGIIACSYEGAALCYKTICNEGAELMGEHAHPEISMHTHPLHEYMYYINRDDWSGVANLMVSSANKLSSIGAEILICPDNTIHKVYNMAKEEVDKPWLHIADEVARQAESKNMKKIGVLGTKYLMESSVYSDSLAKYGLKCCIPNEESRSRINNVILKELVYGVITEESKAYFHHKIDDFKAKGCDGVVLGCTEIPLIVMPEDSSLETLDSTRILARAALRDALEKKE